MNCFWLMDMGINLTTCSMNLAVLQSFNFQIISPNEQHI